MFVHKLPSGQTGPVRTRIAVKTLLPALPYIHSELEQRRETLGTRYGFPPLVTAAPMVCV